MRKFAFPLTDVMKYRDYERDQAQIELGRALATEGAIKRDIDALNQRDEESAATAKGSGDFRMIQSSHEFHAVVKQKTAVLMVQLNEAQKISEEKRGVMRAALQKSEAIHKLYDKQMEEYKEQCTHEEIETQDDIATSRYRR